MMYIEKSGKLSVSDPRDNVKIKMRENLNSGSPTKKKKIISLKREKRLCSEKKMY